MASTVPRPSAAQAWQRRPDPHPTSRAGPGGRPGSAVRHMAVVGWSPGPNPAPSAWINSGTPGGAGACSALRRYQPATHAAGGDGHPGTSSSHRLGSGIASSETACGRSSGRARGAQRRPSPRQRTGCRSARSGKNGLISAWLAAIRSPGGRGERPLTCAAVRSPTLLSTLVERAAPAAAIVGDLTLDERLDLNAESGRRLAAVAELGQPRCFAARELRSALGPVEALPDLAAAIRPRPVLAVSGPTWEAAVFGGPVGVPERLRAVRVLVNEGPLYADPQLVVGGVGDSGLSGARPKVEQLVWARRVHRAAPASREREDAAIG